MIFYQNKKFMNILSHYFSILAALIFCTFYVSAWENSVAVSLGAAAFSSSFVVLKKVSFAVAFEPVIGEGSHQSSFALARRVFWAAVFKFIVPAGLIFLALRYELAGWLVGLGVFFGLFSASMSLGIANYRNPKAADKF